jgi:mRNA interferase MazF
MDVVTPINQFDIYLIELDPTLGSEIKKTRPCIVISPNEMNILKTVIVAPMTTKGIDFPTRIKITFKGKSGQVALDQMRAVDKSRLVKKLGHLKTPTINAIFDVLQEIFSKE